MIKGLAGTSWATPGRLSSGIGHRSWASSLASGSCSWWPPLSCSWPLRLCFAASASAVKVTTTLCPPRERRDAGAGPPPAGSVVPPPHPAVPLSLNISLALRAPLSFTVSRQDAVIPGTDVRSSAEAPGAVTPGMGGKAGVGGACRTGWVFADSPREVLCRAPPTPATFSLSRWTGTLHVAEGTSSCRVQSVSSLASSWRPLVAERSPLRIELHFRQNPSVLT